MKVCEAVPKSYCCGYWYASKSASRMRAEHKKQEHRLMRRQLKQMIRELRAEAKEKNENT